MRSSGTTLRPSKHRLCDSSLFFFSHCMAGPRDKQCAFTIRAKLGLTPQMDVGPYAYEWNPIDRFRVRFHKVGPKQSKTVSTPNNDTSMPK